MRRLFDFLLRKKHWILFICLELIALMLIKVNSVYQRNVMLSSANILSAKVLSISGDVNAYFDLHKENRKLNERNGLLELEVLKLKDQLDMVMSDTLQFRGFVPDSTVLTKEFPYTFYTAKVVNQTIANSLNYITIDKGSEDGVKPEMGVASTTGVVGIVATVGKHYSVVIPIINTKFRLSCKEKNNRYFGSLRWGGRDIECGILEDLPKHITYQKGDTIVTSGYSSIFPPGMVVGYIEEVNHSDEDSFFSFSVKLKTDFKGLKFVHIISNYEKTEQKKVEKEAVKSDS